MRACRVSRAAARCVWLVLGMACARPAFGREASCPPVHVEADDLVLERWPDLPDRVRRAFAQREGIDSCARVALRADAGAITIEVRLLDGRTASRSVAEHEDVVPVLEALLLVPASPAQTLPPASTASPAGPAQPPLVVTRAPGGPRSPVMDDELSAARAPARAPGDQLGIELGVVTSARIGDGQTNIGLGARSLLDLWGWLAGFAGRVSGYGAGNDRTAALEVSVVGGSRFRFETSSLDVIAGPALVLQGTHSVETGPAGSRSETRSGAVPRLVIASHLNFAARSVLRTFAGLEGELGPAGASDRLGDGSTRLPVWMVGVAFGATVGTR